jgi:hypothetical protein
MTLWHLPAALEDQFEERWQHWLDEVETWRPFFQDLAAWQGDDVLTALLHFALVSPAQREAVGTLRRAAEGRAVPLPGTHQPNDEVLTILAAGFARGEPGNPAIPYARLEG